MGYTVEKGWSFPPHFDYPDRPDAVFKYGRVTMTTGEAEINGSLAALFSTRLGERLFRPDFGSSLDTLQFKPMDMVTVNQLKLLIEDAVRKYERRITIKGIDISDSNAAEGRLHFVLHYTIRNDESGADTVYSFTYEYV